jgi:hypothetical protein
MDPMKQFKVTRNGKDDFVDIDYENINMLKS